MPTLKKFLLIPIVAIVCMFTRIDSFYAETCGIPNLDTSIDPDDEYAYAYQNDSAGAYGADGYNPSNYGIASDNTWAVEFSYGTVWGKSRCSTTSGDNHFWAWDAPSSDWTGSPAQESNGTYCWCQVNGFTASGNSYTSGPSCTTTASDTWVVYDDGTETAAYCASNCAYDCAFATQNGVEFRMAVYGVAGYVPTTVSLNWYDGNTQMSGGPSSCTVGGTFLPPTPPARPGYVFTGWKETCASKIKRLDTSTNGSSSTYTGYTRLNGNAGSKESNYGLTTGSGQWAVEFSYGTVWGMAKCSETSGSDSSGTWPESSKSDWLKTPSDTTGKYCWCQVTGFTASGNSYTSGPQCTTTASSLWVFLSSLGSSGTCAANCALSCANRVQLKAALRAGLFGAVGQ